MNRLDQIAQRLAGWQVQIDEATWEREIVGGLDVPVSFVGTFTHKHSAREVQLRCEVVSGEVQSSVVELRRFTDDELESLGIPMMRDYLALTAAVFVGHDLPIEQRAAGVAGIHRVRRRNAVGGKRLTEAARAYEMGGVEAVAQAMGVGERQAWRYVEKAIEAGLTEPRVRQKGARP
jgi:hypothetical protein